VSHFPDPASVVTLSVYKKNMPVKYKKKKEKRKKKKEKRNKKKEKAVPTCEKRLGSLSEISKVGVGATVVDLGPLEIDREDTRLGEREARERGVGS
jgi:hypothetical protein